MIVDRSFVPQRPLVDSFALISHIAAAISFFS